MQLYGRQARKTEVLPYVYFYQFLSVVVMLTPRRLPLYFLAHWHRNSKGDLVRVPLEISPCTARWRIYTPVKLAECPFIGILAVGGPHIHPPPCPAKTPEAYRRIFNWLLESMDWRLANATPRRVLRDEGVIASLRHLLSGAGINPRKEPSLLLLHPSFTNFDHMAWMIDQVKNKYYPNGVDFEGTAFQQSSVCPSPKFFTDVLLQLQYTYAKSTSSSPMKRDMFVERK